MNQSIINAMLAYINDLQRSTELNETFADDVIALLRRAEVRSGDECAQEDMFALARRHRIDAIKCRAKMEAMTEQFVRRFGAERFEQERSKYSALPRRAY